MESKNIRNSYAPCGGCGKYIYNIPVLIDTEESDGEGGFWYQVDGNAVCLDCGEPLNYIHVPPPAYLIIENRETVNIDRGGLWPTSNAVDVKCVVEV